MGLGGYRVGSPIYILCSHNVHKTDLLPKMCTKSVQNVTVCPAMRTDPFAETHLRSQANLKELRVDDLRNHNDIIQETERKICEYST